LHWKISEQLLRKLFCRNQLTMCLRKSLQFILVSIVLFSCWKFPNNNNNGGGGYNSDRKVWGYVPIYGPDSAAKKILYEAGARNVVMPGNIYAFQNYIFQVELGLGIHVIDNSNPSAASRIGFITVRGCSQVSIKNSKLYTNSYDDLVVLDFTDLNNLHEYSRLRGIFSEYKYGSPIAQPPSAGYYTCPRYDSLVVGWTKDSIYQYRSCLK